MMPYLFHIGDVGVPSFFFMIMLSALSATFFAAHMAKKEGLDPVVMLDLGIIGIIASVVGSRIFHILVENPSYYIEHPIRVFYFWQGGFVSIGAYLASASSWVIYLKWRKVDFWRNLDMATLSVPFIEFFVRVGCLMVGCCYGKPTDFFIHLIFTDPASIPLYYDMGGIPLHATQLYFMLNAVVMLGVLYLVYKSRKFYGQVLAAFLIYYSVTRFFIEFLRADEDRGLWFGKLISTGQIAMIFSLCIGIAIWLWRRRKPIS
jgi:phosphatidylglycerol:prolipoprotein diacylglycerol transferase